MRTLMLLLLAAGALAGTPQARTVSGRGVSFKVPHAAAKGRFVPQEDGRHRFQVATNTGGLGTLSVTVGPRNDPGCTLVNELVGAEATARLPAFRRANAHVLPINRSRGVESIENRGGVKVVHAVSWSATRLFELELAAASPRVDPRSHHVWKALVASFRSNEAPLR